MATTPVEITLANLAGGALMECATAELRRICENIQDPNVDATAKRKLTIEIILVPDETRQHLKLAYGLKANIPGPDGGKTTAFIAMGPDKNLALFEAYIPQNLFPEQELLASAVPLATKKA